MWKLKTLKKKIEESGLEIRWIDLAWVYGAVSEKPELTDDGRLRYDSGSSNRVRQNLSI